MRYFLLIALLGFAVSPATAATAATLRATPSTFSSVIEAARGGDRVILGPGVYKRLTIKNISHRERVTITGPSAILTGLMVHNARGLVFENLEFYSEPAGEKNPFIVRRSEDIHFKAINAHGSLDNDPKNDQAGLMVRESSRVSVTGSEFHQLFVGFSHLDSRDLTVSGNRFHDLQMDGVRGGGSDRVVVADNHFTDFYPKPGDHPDAIQFWGANTTTSASDITVTGNVILRGKGKVMQGVFVRDGSGLRPFKNVQITNNVVIGGMYNGIAVDNGENVQITNNVVAGFPDMKSWIRVQKVLGLKLGDNRAQTFLVEGKALKGLRDGNKLVSSVRDGGLAIVQARRGVATAR